MKTIIRHNRIFTDKLIHTAAFAKIFIHTESHGGG